MILAFPTNSKLNNCTKNRSRGGKKWSIFYAKYIKIEIIKAWASLQIKTRSLYYFLSKKEKARKKVYRWGASIPNKGKVEAKKMGWQYLRTGVIIEDKNINNITSRVSKKK